MNRDFYLKHGMEKSARVSKYLPHTIAGLGLAAGGAGLYNLRDRPEPPTFMDRLGASVKGFASEAKNVLSELATPENLMALQQRLAPYTPQGQVQFNPMQGQQAAYHQPQYMDAQQYQNYDPSQGQYPDHSQGQYQDQYQDHSQAQVPPELQETYNRMYAYSPYMI